MNNKNDKFLNTYFVSPLEVRHYVLDIPVTKSKYQYNAVKFALKPLYPGNDDTAIIDYVIKNKRIIGIAGNSERIHFFIMNTSFHRHWFVVILKKMESQFH